MVIGFCFITIVIISFLVTGKWRKICRSLVLVVLFAYSIFFVVRPFWIDAQIDKKVTILRLYLEQHYPNEEWVISTVPHREEGYKHANPYYIGVVFESEPDVIYKYWVESKSDIYQISFSRDNLLDELEHLE
ncbi:hypothetical protein [Cytobacillus sp. IB215665]|uniref:hypothetical protein n=1 Tax=Cytobacillus sp. IB215665 TaxID=3097357 RepID=UPI002A114902|nr:hypothetical protein [Cytobacillus sp. IB215665]MDX8363930.1 hypothetical protein [Cytobacillus sp. IB215665]